MNKLVLLALFGTLCKASVDMLTLEKEVMDEIEPEISKYISSLVKERAGQKV